MAWSRYQQFRLANDQSVLRREFRAFDFYDRAAATYISGIYTSNMNYSYTLRINIPPGYPDECPSTYITNPSPLWGHSQRMDEYGTSHAMHTWQTDRPGWLKICTYRPELWSAQHSIVKVVRKGMLWIAAYECHLQDGSPVANYLVSS
ncbi:hypothetical protein [Streptosporangium sp. KLBMP 9127]|nr:hypothetical protein [Streptosporangium sp. KLBMP 9127]